MSDNTAAQLMAELGLVARAKRRRRGLTRQGKRPAALDLVRPVTGGNRVSQVRILPGAPIAAGQLSGALSSANIVRAGSYAAAVVWTSVSICV